MPIAGLGLHFIIALFFAIHAVRSGRELYWLILLFSFPLLGSLVYFLAIFLPQSRLERTLGKAGKTVVAALNPGRALREAQQAFDLTPTAHNQTRLAKAMLEAGMHAQAVAQFDACLAGPFANDPDIIFDAAQARLANGQHDGAIAALLGLQQGKPSFRTEQVSVLLARAYAAAGMHAQAGQEFATTVQRFTGIEARVEYALWALSRREAVVAQEQIRELAHSRKHMNKYTRSLHDDMFKRLDSAVRMQGRQ
ncbi:hypothetical protein [Massilia sp. TSP1-1-2]|uniref:hypothetical protein n=1 Tax=unclassified Massilia TaxID=2609279 RepID=UPI003CEBF83F